MSEDPCQILMNPYLCTVHTNAQFMACGLQNYNVKEPVWMKIYVIHI